MNFEQILPKLKNGSKVTRGNWTNLSFVVYQKGYPDGIPSNKQTAEAFNIKEGDLFIVPPYLQARTVDKKHVMWSPTATDVLADDWIVLS